MLQQGIEVRKYLSARAGIHTVLFAAIAGNIIRPANAFITVGLQWPFSLFLIILFPLTGILNIVKQHFIFKNVFLTYIIQ